MILSEKITEELKTSYQKLIEQGDLPSKDQLAQYYRTFRQRFGPDKLQSLNGETLLDTMHAHGNQDSLVYWLEFKNDEEFPAQFGSIAGGSALKFGIYKRRETGIWMTGSPQNQQELSVAEAIEIAGKHRDRLVAGANLLEKLPVNGTDEDYRNLQEQMDLVAPDVSGTSWGHKYFSLLYPDKLDDYHNPDYQRFHLITLLQIPPAGEGRYLVAGRYVAIANELGMPLNHLTSLLNRRNRRPHRYWRIGTQLGGTNDIWPMMKKNGTIAIGWEKLGDLSYISQNQESKDKLLVAMEIHDPNSPQQIGKNTKQVFDFVATIQENDIILAAAGNTVLGIGRVTGKYSYEAGSDAPHRRPVEWLSWDAWKMPNPEGLRRTVYEIRKNVDNQIEIERRILPEKLVLPPPVGPDGPVLPPTLTGIPGRIQTILERKRQVILYGPPGTGKTYWAERTARDLAAYACFGQAFSDLPDEKQSAITGAEKGHGLVRLCSFHPAYGYEDFLEGYRPQETNGQLAFTRRDGIFKKLCADAGENPSTKFYLIIDEINRGDIPRIFGELLTILEKDKRHKSILLPLSGEPFHVPDNVYLIGTMNTADRSIALLDTALRRRFGFIELMPDSSALGNVVIEGIPLGPWLNALNNAICEHIGRKARNLQIGHAYFLDGDKPVSGFAELARIIHDDILPLLEEYCYEDYETLNKILGEGLVDKNKQRIRHEIFTAGREDDLIQALKAIDPNLDTSIQAVTAEGKQTENADDEEETVSGGADSDEAGA